jgi:DNA modification methylase
VDDLRADEFGGVRLFNADCLDVLPHLTGIDAVITDPPYGISYATNFAVGGVGATWRGDRIAGDGDTAARDAVLDFARSRNIPWACFGSWKVPKPAGVRGVLIWDKGPAFGMGDLSFPWKGSWEEIYVGGPGWNGRRDEGVLRGHLVHSHESQGRTHPTEKPVSLLRELVRKLPPGCVILDPFAGSGSLGLAAMLEGRRAVLIESDAGHYAAALKRLRAADGQGGLFEGVPSRQLTMPGEG